jgi:hypothetical protein
LFPVKREQIVPVIQLGTMYQFEMGTFKFGLVHSWPNVSFNWPYFYSDFPLRRPNYSSGRKLPLKEILPSEDAASEAATEVFLKGHPSTIDVAPRQF